MTTDIHAVPENLPPIPYGFAYLGNGPIPIPERRIRADEVYAARDGGLDHMWDTCEALMSDLGTKASDFSGGNEAWHYAAPLESDITRHILAHRVPDGVPILPEGWVYAGTLGDYEGRCSGLALYDGKEWSKSRGWLGMARRPDGISYGWHFAVKIDSPLARKLLVLAPETRPSWEDAPSWAEWRAQDADGGWWYYSDRPESDAWRDEWQKTGGSTQHFDTGKPNRDWRLTLEPRPAQEGTTREVGNLTIKIDATDMHEAVTKAIREAKMDGYLPDLCIPKDAAEAMCGYSWIEELAEAGYRIEVDEHGLRGWKGD